MWNYQFVLIKLIRAYTGSIYLYIYKYKSNKKTKNNLIGTIATLDLCPDGWFHVLYSFQLLLQTVINKVGV